MDFADKIRKIADDIRRWIDRIHTEEATKTSFIQPFIRALGYNINDPTEVVPEYTADVGTKKGEKVDYAKLPKKNIEVRFCGKRNRREIFSNVLTG